MKTVCIIPIKSNSIRLKSKNFLKIKKKPLYSLLLDKLSSTNFNEIYIDSDSDEIKHYCLKKNFKFIERKPNLKKNTANGNDLLNYHQKIISADIYFQLFVTAPLLSIKTINECIRILKTTKKYDSILTYYEQYVWAWFNNKPINYKPNILPRSQDAKPICIESTGLYGIKKDILKKSKCRIGKNPFFFKIDELESLDIDTKIDFLKLRFYMDNANKLKEIS